MTRIRTLLDSLNIPPEAASEIESFCAKEASYANDLEAEIKRLNSELGKNTEEQEGYPSVLRKQWDQSKGKFDGPHGLHDQPLEEIEEKILWLLSKSQYVKAEQIGTAFSMSEQKAILFLTRLSELTPKPFVEASIISRPQLNQWSLTQDGRAYLHSKGSLD